MNDIRFATLKMNCNDGRNSQTPAIIIAQMASRSAIATDGGTTGGGGPLGKIKWLSTGGGSAELAVTYDSGPWQYGEPDGIYHCHAGYYEQF